MQLIADKNACDYKSGSPHINTRNGTCYKEVDTDAKIKYI